MQIGKGGSKAALSKSRYEWVVSVLGYLNRHTITQYAGRGNANTYPSKLFVHRMEDGLAELRVGNIAPKPLGNGVFGEFIELVGNIMALVRSVNDGNTSNATLRKHLTNGLSDPCCSACDYGDLIFNIHRGVGSCIGLVG